MGLMISKIFEGELHFPEKGWGVVGRKTAEHKKSEEALLMVRPDDQRSVAEYLAEVLSSKRTATGIELPDSATEFDEFEAVQIRLERTLERSGAATAIYAPEEP